MNRILSTWLPASLAFLVAAGGAAQSADPKDYQFTDVIDVQLVNVEVWVTDKAGVPVTGLQAEDFELYEDGKPVEISHFSEIRQDTRLAASAPGSAMSPAATTEASSADAEPSHLILYFDEFHLSPPSRRRAIQDISSFLATEEVDPRRVLILSQDSSLTTEATFGSSWTELDTALQRLGRTPTRGSLSQSEKRLTILNLQQLWDWAQDVAGLAPNGDSNEAACEFFLPRAIPDIESYAAESRQRIAASLDLLASAASFLTGVPGPKTMLYVSDALERAPGTDLVSFVNDLCPVQAQTPMFLLSDELSQHFRRLTRHANANRVTIYALQAHGLENSFLSGASQGTVELRSLNAFDAALRTSERDGLSTLAAETGGRTIFNANRFGEELEEIGREMSSYYSLAYAPPHGGDQAEHEIEVKLKNKQLRARHRRGYRDKSADVRMTERLQGAVYLGLVDNPLGVRLAAGAVREADTKGFLRLPIHVLVPAEKVVFLPRDGGVTGQISVQVSTRNTVDQKGIFDHRAYRINWETPADRKMIDLTLELEVPPGVHLVAVGVRDDATHDTSFVSTTLEVHPTTPAVAARR
jgi:VWFA-related protein